MCPVCKVLTFSNETAIIVETKKYYAED